MDKVAELIKAGKAKEIADMRDETDLNGLKLAIDLKRGTDPDKLMAKLFRMTTLAGQLQLQLQRAHRRAAPGAGRAADFGGVDRLAHRVRPPPGLLRPEQAEGKAPPAQGPQAHSAGHRQGRAHHPGDGGGGRRGPQPDDRLRHRPGPGGVRGGDQAAATSTRSISSSGSRRSRASQDGDRTTWRTCSGSPKRVKKIIIDELTAVEKKYGQPRRTVIVYGHEAEAAEGGGPVADYPGPPVPLPGGLLQEDHRPSPCG